MSDSVLFSLAGLKCNYNMYVLCMYSVCMYVCMHGVAFGLARIVFMAGCLLVLGSVICNEYLYSNEILI